jgi:hypothetical protein
MRQLFLLGVLLTHCSASNDITHTEDAANDALGIDGGTNDAAPLESGDVVWTVDLPVAGTQTAVNMLVANDDLYVSTSTQTTTNVVRIRPDGTIAWKWSDSANALLRMRTDTKGIVYMVFSKALGGTNGNSNVFVALAQDTGAVLWTRAIDFSVKYCLGYCAIAQNNVDSITAFEASDGFVYYSGSSFNQNHFFGLLASATGTSAGTSPFYTYEKTPFTSMIALKDGSLLVRKGNATERWAGDLGARDWTRPDAMMELRASGPSLFFAYDQTTGALDVRNLSDGMIVPAQALPIFDGFGARLHVDASEAFVYLSGLDTATSMEKIEKYDRVTGAKAWGAAPGLARSIHGLSKAAAYLLTAKTPLEIARHDLSDGKSGWRKPIAAANCDFNAGPKLLAYDDRVLIGYCHQESSHVLRIERRLP